MGFAFVFPGQGSQSVGMMAAYGESSVIRKTFDEASEALGQDLWQMVSDGPAEVLAQTVNTQPLMLTAAIAVYRLWLAKGGAIPAVVAGHSLGEYSALVAAGALKFQDAVPLVRLRAAAMQEAVPVGQGAMAAILNLADEKIAEACREAVLSCPDGMVVEPVNFNGPGQTVIAGSKQAVEKACELCKEKGAKRAVLLPVSAPFHSSLIKPAAVVLAEGLAKVEISEPQIPVVNNVDVAVVSEAAQIRDALVRQAYSPVRWVETMQKIAQMDVQSVYECGPGKVLAGLVKRCADTLTGIALCDEASLDNNTGAC